MARELTPKQAKILGIWSLGTCLAVGLVFFGLFARQGTFADTFDLTVGFPEVHDIEAGTPVRIRGLDVGQVTRVDYPDFDTQNGESLVWVRMSIQKRYADRLYANAVARIQSRGLLSTQMIAIHPGSPEKGQLTKDHIQGELPFDLAGTTKKLASIAERADAIMGDLQQSQGTLAKLLKDDALYKQLVAVAEDSRTAIRGVTKTVDRVQSEVSGVKELVQNGQATVESLKQNADAIKAMPLVRNYVQDPVSVLIRPDSDRSRQIFAEADLFEPGRAVLTESGRLRVIAAADWLKGETSRDSDVVVVSFADANTPDQTPQMAKTLTQRQSEVVVDLLREHGAHKIGWWSRRNVTAIGYGIAPLPYIEKEKLPGAHLQIVLFVKRS
ncbi:MlaD family protein [Tuwongella immobilis]|uniref:Mce/MlaD domain-containing protein n=1 Tax=Tuwongella immobilis TaxID=692036 RepID=A0A6C2YS70_9BACT|nr:MlaD family protein [Tuwongella immobilis]VIP04518.1 ABC-type transport system involved in resistance to organic solvents, periplasmic component OS=Singulisphaera acidiphila (strain ATCC BAA-1392 / DSM 18658 / VKM B-2454 / MOB10) GN=Sinac_1321 PE=4 SV=1: MCE: OmpA [Tuwongella immobilis]VTS06398.1 ABC-type transport system involved in resistance to organic solvents, periplasmic component OS=Singulisphaera acidiphila (strain ATCC BAA-1392 / DSM 18658 / VKM B-2454 / MOB10) GN=Sinac_1321 PE=4 SV=1